MKRPLVVMDIIGPYLRAVSVVSSVAIEHPEWSAEKRQALLDRAYDQEILAAVKRRKRA